MRGDIYTWLDHVLALMGFILYLGPFGPLVYAFLRGQQRKEARRLRKHMDLRAAYRKFNWNETGA